MSVLAALAPPFLVAAVVVVAIVAFLRHEMGRARADRGAGTEGNSDQAAAARDERDDGAGSGADPASSAKL